MKKPTININIHNLVGAMHVTDKGLSTGDFHKKFLEIFTVVLRDAHKAAYIFGPIRPREEILLELDKIANRLEYLVLEAKEIDLEIQADVSKSFFKYRKFKFSLVEIKHNK